MLPESLAQHSLNVRQQCLPSSASRQNRGAVTKLRFAYRRRYRATPRGFALEP